MGSPDLSRSTGLAGAGTADRTSTPRQGAAPRGPIVRWTGDLEALAVDLLDRLGPAAVTILAGALVTLAGEVTR